MLDMFAWPVFDQFERSKASVSAFLFDEFARRASSSLKLGTLLDSVNAPLECMRSSPSFKFHPSSGNPSLLSSNTSTSSSSLLRSVVSGHWRHFPQPHERPVVLLDALHVSSCKAVHVEVDADHDHARHEKGDEGRDERIRRTERKRKMFYH
jgi:hypothetical protein